MTITLGNPLIEKMQNKIKLMTEITERSKVNRKTLFEIDCKRERESRNIVYKYK